MRKHSETNGTETWDAFLGSGLFDEIDHPEEGYRIGDPVAYRSGIFSIIRGFKDDGRVIIALDEEPDGSVKIVETDDIRPNGDVVHALFAGEFVNMPEGKLMVATPPTDFPGKDSRLN